MILAYLVDDEPHALNILNYKLSQIDVKVVGQQDNPLKAMEEINELRPDVVFLDIEMPGFNGIEVAERLKAKHKNLCIVYTTASKEYAIKAFEQHTLDYVLKPIDMKRLQRTVERIQEELHKLNGLNIKEPLFHAYTFERFELFIQPEQEHTWRTSKAKELFGLLILYSDRGMLRDELIELLWPDEEFIKSKIYLHASVSIIRKSLMSLGMDNILRFHNGKYYLDTINLKSDYRWILKALPHALQWIVDGDTLQVEQLLSIYRGPLFADCDYIWARGEANRLHKSIAHIRLALAKHYFEHNHYHQAANTAEPLLDDFLVEDASTLLIAIYEVLKQPEHVARVQRIRLEGFE